MTDEEIERIRAALISVNKAGVSWKYLHKVMETAKLGLTVSPDTLGRFGAPEGTRRLSEAKDLKRLATFLFATETGRLMRGMAAEADSVFERIMGNLHVRLPHERAKRVEGRYYCLHGSVFDRRLFTVRLLKVERETSAVVAITSMVRSRRPPNQVQQSYGFLVYDKELFVIVMLHQDDLMGLNYVVPYWVEPPEGEVQSMVAQMLGISARQRLVSRAVCITRIPDAIAEDTALEQTGHYSKKELPDDFREVFQEMAENAAQQDVRDPVFSLDPGA
jgi:hypothetical protein